jgi:uncharacterized protein
MQYDLSILNWSFIFIAAFVIGLAKAGLKGIDMLNVTLMAIVFGGKASTGVVLPLLCAADVIAVVYYRRHAQWPYVFKLLPWMVIGILIGVYAGKEIDEGVFRKVMAVIIVLAVVIMFWLELRKDALVPKTFLFAATLGLVSGFTTMLGNLAGAFSNIYFLALRMNKNDFIGTAAWMFLIINLLKLPFQIFYWKNIDTASLRLDIYLLPAMFAGFWCGLKVVERIKDDGYRKVILALTLVGSVFIFLR